MPPRRNAVNKKTKGSIYKERARTLENLVRGTADDPVYDGTLSKT